MLLGQELLVDDIATGEAAFAHEASRPLLASLGQPHGLRLVLDRRKPHNAVQAEYLEMQHVLGRHREPVTSLWLHPIQQVIVGLDGYRVDRQRHQADSITITVALDQREGIAPQCHIHDDELQEVQHRHERVRLAQQLLGAVGTGDQLASSVRILVELQRQARQRLREDLYARPNHADRERGLGGYTDAGLRALAADLHVDFDIVARGGVGISEHPPGAGVIPTECHGQPISPKKPLLR
ncbi:hypothetical protein D3C78_1194950 [compost metagenome]